VLKYNSIKKNFFPEQFADFYFHYFRLELIKQMKKFSTALAIIWFVSINVISQVSITTADLPLANQNYNLVQALPLELADPALSAGMDMTWDYSSLEPLNTTVQSFIPVSATPFLYQFLFGQANHATAGEDLELGDMLSFTDV
jgi:hypothetical protein